MRRSTFKAWFLVHKWSSLVCTVFLLMLCVTGLPLIFGEEIAHLSGAEPEVASVPAGTPHAPADVLVQRALAQYPGDVPLFFGWDEDAGSVYVNTGARTDTPPPQMHTVVFNQYTGEVLPVPQFNEGVMYFILRLHSVLFAGLPGGLLLGLMALLFAAAIVSGVVLYAPFMRKLPFGTLRRGKQGRMRWLDMHNFLGSVTLAWALVVALTGAINTLAVPLQQSWQSQQLAGVTDIYRDAPIPEHLASLDQAIHTARMAEPDMTPGYVSFPGTGYSGEHHYGVFMHGSTALTERIYRPVLIDAASGELTAKPALPLVMKVLLLSQPLHFGDYGGLPLKILWALLDLITIVVLISGLYLWARRGSTKKRMAAFERRRQAGPEGPAA